YQTVARRFGGELTRHEQKLPCPYRVTVRRRRWRRRRPRDGEELQTHGCLLTSRDVPWPALRVVERVPRRSRWAFTPTAGAVSEMDRGRERGRPDGRAPSPRVPRCLSDRRGRPGSRAVRTAPCGPRPRPAAARTRPR